MNWNNFEIQVKTFYGLEEVLAAEIKSLGGSNIEIRNRAVICHGDSMFLYKLNYSLRSALKITVPIHTFDANNDEALYHQTYAFSWEDFIPENTPFFIDFTVFSKYFSHSQYAMLKVKDAIVDRLRDKRGKRPSISTEEKAIKVHLHIQNNKVTLSLDSSGEPLYKRGYRVKTGQAPINEVLAAGLILLSNWDAGSHFLDPMCGSGTLLIEAAMYAYNIPSQIHRKHFGFMNWNHFIPEDWEKIKEIRNNKMREFPYTITGYDLSEEMVENSKINIDKADFHDLIEVEQKDFFETEKQNAPLTIIMNPPYNERLGVPDSFYKNIGDTLKQQYPHTTLWMISGDSGFEKKIGLKSSRKINLYNGKLECKFVKYESYKGSKKQNKND